MSEAWDDTDTAVEPDDNELDLDLDDVDVWGEDDDEGL